MKIKRIVPLQVITLLMLTTLLITPMMSASASPGLWYWIPGTYHYHCQNGSNRTLSICTYPTDLSVTNKTIPYGCQQYYDMEFSEPNVAGNVTITVPVESYHSEPFFLKVIPSIITFYLWCQVYAVADGIGTLATRDNILDASPVSTNVTGDEGTFTTTITIGDGAKDPAGSALLYMPLNMDVWLGTSETDPTMIPDGFLFALDFPMWTTTGFTEARIIDPTPYPSGSVSMNGYYMNATGVRFNAFTGTGTLVASGAGLDIYAYLLGILHAWTDYIFLDFQVLATELPPPVGGVWIPVDKLALLAPYIGLASAIVLAIATTAAFFKYRKKL